MSTIAIYLDTDTEQRLRRAAEQEGLPVSRLVGRWVMAYTSETWPREVLDLAGSWADEPLERPAHLPDAPRADL